MFVGCLGVLPSSFLVRKRIEDILLMQLIVRLKAKLIVTKTCHIKHIKTFTKKKHDVGDLPPRESYFLPLANVKC